MPNRIIREGILSSDRVDQLDPPAEVFYRRLMSKVDDHGLYDARPAILRTSLYPLRVDRVREADIARWIAACEMAGVIALYQHDGKPYLQMLDTRWQARSEPKFPLPPEAGRKQPPAPAINCAQTPAPAPVFVGVVGVVGAVDTPPPPAEAGGAFGQFWDLWPKHQRKVARKQCEDKWRTKGCEAVADQVLAALEIWKGSEAWAKHGGEFIPAPLVWLNQSRWEALPEASAPSVAPSITVPSNAAELTKAQQEAEAARLADPAARAAAEAARVEAMRKLGRPVTAGAIA